MHACLAQGSPGSAAALQLAPGAFLDLTLQAAATTSPEVTVDVPKPHRMVLPYTAVAELALPLVFGATAAVCVVTAVTTQGALDLPGRNLACNLLRVDAFAQWGGLNMNTQRVTMALHQIQSSQQQHRVPFPLPHRAGGFFGLRHRPAQEHRSCAGSSSFTCALIHGLDQQLRCSITESAVEHAELVSSLHEPFCCSTGNLPRATWPNQVAANASECYRSDTGRLTATTCSAQMPACLQAACTVRMHPMTRLPCDQARHGALCSAAQNLPAHCMQIA